MRRPSTISLVMPSSVNRKWRVGSSKGELMIGFSMTTWLIRADSSIAPSICRFWPPSACFLCSGASFGVFSMGFATLEHNFEWEEADRRRFDDSASGAYEASTTDGTGDIQLDWDRTVESAGLTVAGLFRRAGGRAPVSSHLIPRECRRGFENAGRGIYFLACGFGRCHRRLAFA